MPEIHSDKVPKSKVGDFRIITNENYYKIQQLQKKVPMGFLYKYSYDLWETYSGVVVYNGNKKQIDFSRDFDGGKSFDSLESALKMIEMLKDIENENKVKPWTVCWENGYVVVGKSV